MFSFKHTVIAGVAYTMLSVSVYADCDSMQHGAQVMAQAAGQEQAPQQQPQPGAASGSAEQASEAKKEAAVKAYDPAEGNKPAESWFGCSQGVHNQGGDEKDCLPQNQDKTHVK